MSLKNTVLILNASYEPLGTISIENAFCLYFKDKIYVEENTDRIYRSTKQSWFVPSVIRLKYYVPINKKRADSAGKRSKIYIRDRFRCSYCGKSGNAKDLTLDHLIPKAKNGTNYPDNLVTCCYPCNQRKKDFTLEECGMKLIHTPKQLKVGLDKVVAGHWGDLRPTWRKYLYIAEDSSGDNRYSHNE